MSKNSRSFHEVILRRAIQRRGITQKELAEKIGVEQHTISNWMRQPMPPFAVCRYIMMLDELKIPASRFIHECEERSAQNEIQGR